MAVLDFPIFFRHEKALLTAILQRCAAEMSNMLID